MRLAVASFATFAALAAVSGAAGDAHAQAQLAVRPAKLVWDKGVLRGTFSYQDAIDDVVRKKIANGLPVTIVMRGYVYPVAGGDPVALTAHTCKVAYELWTEVFRVVVNNQQKPPTANMKGVYRLCTDMKDLPIVDRSALKGKPQDYFLGVKVEVNPVSDKLLAEVLRWVTRPLGVSGSISAGDALFATFVGVFMKKKVASADRVLEFRTAPFPP